MLYPNMTYELILGRMLERVESWARGRNIGIDTREGSLIRTALSPAAVELMQMYIAINEVMNESFADTETRDFLIRKCKERGITPYPATFAIRRGEFNIPVPIGSRYSLNKLNYVTVATSPGESTAFQMRCETAGNAGNIESGDLIPIDYVDGLTFARLTDVLIPADDEEETEHLRQRYFDSLNALAYGGNIQDYVEKAMLLQGVGGIKVYPIWRGGGTVKLVIVDSLFGVPSPTLVDAVQTAFDPIPNQGLGLGVAPIGHTVTVEGVTAETVDVHTNIVFADGYNWNMLKPLVEETIDGYFIELAGEWDKGNWRLDPTATLIVRVREIETRIFALQGVVDIDDVALNGQPRNLTLDVDGIPVRGTVTNG